MTKFYLIIICLLLFIGCTTRSTLLEETLKKSGDNRKELEYVLSHYSQKESDSLKLKAAIFLIENMPGHYACGGKYVSHYIDTMSALYPGMSNIVKKVVYNIPFRDENLPQKSHKVEDIRVIKGDFLIRHIDNALQIWENCKWLRSCTFEDFCEYILPYRMDHEPLLESDSTMYLWQKVVEAMNYYNYVPQTMSEIKTFQRDLLGHIDDLYFKGINIPDLSSNYKFDCLDVCYYEVNRLRAVGLPAVIDFVPGWPYRNGKHFWRVMIDRMYWNHNYCDVLNYVTAKIYRMTYSHNPVPVPDGKDSIPLLFKNPFIKDVTKQYIGVSDIEYEIKKPLTSSPHYLYLSIFNDLGWKTIAWATVKSNKATFSNMGRGVVYLPVFYDGKKEQNAGYPFLLDTNQKIITYIPNKENRISLHITRKFPLNDTKIIWGENLKGCCIEAANRPDFRDADTLYTINRLDQNLNYNTVKFKNETSYRYWRISKPNQKVCIGDWQLFDKDYRRLIGTPISGEENDKTIEKAFDDDVLTFANSLSWIGIDLGKKVDVRTLKFVPRTDSNGIVPGYSYELLYYDENGWRSIGYKTAIKDYIDFESVPEGALYWLKNEDEGQEERIFTYENGRVVFW